LPGKKALKEVGGTKEKAYNKRLAHKKGAVEHIETKKTFH